MRKISVTSVTSVTVFIVCSVCQIFISGRTTNVLAKPMATVEAAPNVVCPKIISRREWKAREVSNHRPLVLSPAPYVVVHHGGIQHYCFKQETCSEIVRSYQNLHIDDRGWIDIGYQFIIGEDGNIYEGRGWNFIGAHAPGYNAQSIGISIIGDFSQFLPNKGALDALDSLVECGVSIGKIGQNYKLIGHRQVRSTECPGTCFYQYVKTLPGWTDVPKPLSENLTISDTPNNHEVT